VSAYTGVLTTIYNLHSNAIYTLKHNSAF